MDRDGNISINLFDIINDLDDDSFEWFARHVACKDIVIESVSDQILGSCDAKMNFGSSCGTNADPVTPLDMARRKVAKGANEASRLEIERLEDALVRKERRVDELNRLIDAMRYLGAEDHFRSACRQLNRHEERP